VRPARTLLLSLALALAVVAPARAATYASPSGGGDCSQANPCGLQTALTNAASSDHTAIALPGDYILPGPVTVPDGVTLQGTPGADVAGATGVAGLSTSAGTIEQIVVEGFGAGGSALELGGAATVRDAVARASDGADAIVVDTSGGAALTNVTAYASGTGAAIHDKVLAPPTVFSSILHADGQAVLTDPLAFAPSFDAYTNQGTADPQFVNPPTDLRLKKGSPAVDAADPNDAATGRSDADGLQRQFGARVDLGAYELTPPSATTAPVTNVTQTGATINGSVVPNARETQYSVVYGSNPAALSSQPGATLAAGTAAVPVSQALINLKPGTTYYVSLVASNSAGVVATPLATFQTQPKPAPPRRAATIRLTGSGRVRMDSRRRWRVSVQCPKGELYSCQGVLAVRSVNPLRFGPTTKRLVFGSLRFDVPAGKTALVGPSLTKAKLALVRRLRGVLVTVSVITQGAALDDQRYFARRFTLLPPR
jgi:hypothetical protein